MNFSYDHKLSESVSIDSQISTEGFSICVPSKSLGPSNLCETLDWCESKHNSSTVIPGKKSITDFTIVHMNTQSTDSFPSPSKYENQYEIIPHQKIQKQLPVFNYVISPGRNILSAKQQISNKETVMHNRITEVEEPETTREYKTNNLSRENKIKIAIDNSGCKMIMTNQFKPSNLFTITERLSKEKMNKKVNEANHADRAKDEQKRKGNSGMEPKTATVNLIDLIKSYTKNPQLEQKIKMNKVSFLTNNKKFAHDNKENQNESQNHKTLIDSGKTRNQVQDQNKKQFENNPPTQNNNNHFQEKLQLKEKNDDNFCKNTTKLLKIKPNRSRSKSGESFDQKKLGQLLNENPISLASQVRSSSSSKRRSASITINNLSSILVSSGMVNNTDILQKEYDHMILHLQKTVEDLMKKAEDNKQEIQKLRHIQEVKAKKMQMNKTKLDELLNQHNTSKSSSQGETLLNRILAAAEESSELFNKKQVQNISTGQESKYSKEEETINGLEQKIKCLEEILQERVAELKKIQNLLLKFNQKKASDSRTLRNAAKIEIGTQTISELNPIQSCPPNSEFIKNSFLRISDLENPSQ